MGPKVDYHIHPADDADFASHVRRSLESLSTLGDLPSGWFAVAQTRITERYPSAYLTHRFTARSNHIQWEVWRDGKPPDGEIRQTFWPGDGGRTN